MLIDGTMLIDTQWEIYSGRIYKTTIGTDVWQLFVDNEMAQPARWPNSFKVTRPDYGGKNGPEPGSFWDMDGTRAYQGEGSTYGRMVNNPTVHDLAATGRDFTGAMVVGYRMIVNANDLFYEEVTGHTAGENEFQYG